MFWSLLQTTDQPLVPNPPQGGSIVSTSRDEVTETTIWTLSNGVTVVLKNTDFEDNKVMFSAQKWGGTSAVSDDDYLSASQASGLAASSGLGAFTATALAKRTRVCKPLTPTSCVKPHCT